VKRAKSIALIALTAACLFATAGSAQAGSPDSWIYSSTFGEGLNTSLGNLVVNHQTGNILAMGSDGKVHQFDAAGNPVDFAATGSPTVSASGQIAISNGGSTKGNFYVWDGQYVHTFHADGSPIGESKTVGAEKGPGVFEPISEGTFEGELFFPLGGGGIFVEPDGTLWVGLNVLDFETFGTTAEIAEVSPEMVPTGVKEKLTNYSLGGPTAMSPAGILYVIGGYSTQVTRFDSANHFANGGSFNLALEGGGQQIAVEPATEDIYQVAAASGGFDPTAEPIGSVSATHPDATETTPPIAVLKAEGGLLGGKGIAFDAAGEKMYVSEGKRIRVFRNGPPIAPWEVGATRASEIRAFSAVLQSSFIDGNAQTTYKFEYGLTDSYGQETPAVTAPHRFFSQVARAGIGGLQPDTTYHFRIVATNSVGTTEGPDGTFKTYPIPPGADSCSNALARKQTISQRLPDCRGYELASASDTGGFDVESDLVPGQQPFPGYPKASGRLLYATHSGAVPGPWNATNKGPDPYVATRGDNGWVTRYEGLPSDLNPAAGSFASVLGEADPSLSTLAFAGPNLCSPCFSSGLRTGIPVRLPDGRLVQGMSGSLAASVPDTAEPEGTVAKYFSDDGEHLIFASKYAFEPGANSGGPDLTVYDRDLSAGTTQIVSTDENGDALTGTVSELDVSADGSRIVTAIEVSSDSAGNENVHPYMHLGSSPASVDLAPGTSSGVRYAGMTADGSRVFFTTADALEGNDTDNSADLYEAAVGKTGNLTLSKITGPSSNACDPVSNSNGAHWNSNGAGADCDAVAISGGGGVASASGAIYFLSPELLDGTEGTADQPNLYLAEPGASPTFVATLEPDNPLVLDSVKAGAARRTADFQVAPSGNYAAFTSKLDLAGLRTGGFAGVYLYNVATGHVDCVSCDLTGTADAGAFGDAELPSDGLALLDDGRLLFTTGAQLLLNDTNGRKDVYEWTTRGKQELISAGTGPFDSALLSASADGVDVFFFTHDALASEEDHNGALVRIYDAREGGGFFKLPRNLPCQASDECHGPSSPIPPPSDIKSSGITTSGNVVVCPKNRVKKRGACVKKPHHKKKRHHKKKHHHKKHHSKKRGSHA
jgi:hypothetical protein